MQGHNPAIERAGLTRGFHGKKPDPIYKNNLAYMKGYKAGKQMLADLNKTK